MFPGNFSTKDVRIDSTYLLGGGFYRGFNLHLHFVLFCFDNNHFI